MKKGIVAVLVLALQVGAVTLLFRWNNVAAAATDSYPVEHVAWLAGWGYRVRLKLLPRWCEACYHKDYPVRIVLYYNRSCNIPDCVNLEGRCRPDFADILFTLADGVTPLFHIYESIVPGQVAVVWVRVPYELSKPYTIFLYYGNPDVTGYYYLDEIQCSPFFDYVWECYSTNYSKLFESYFPYGRTWPEELIPRVFPLANRTITGFALREEWIWMKEENAPNVWVYHKYPIAGGLGSLPWGKGAPIQIYAGPLGNYTAIRVMPQLDEFEASVLLVVDRWVVAPVNVYSYPVCPCGLCYDPCGVFLQREGRMEAYAFLPILSIGVHIEDEEMYDIPKGLKDWWQRQGIFSLINGTKFVITRDASGLLHFINGIRFFIAGDVAGVQVSHHGNDVGYPVVVAHDPTWVHFSPTGIPTLFSVNDIVQASLQNLYACGVDFTVFYDMWITSVVRPRVFGWRAFPIDMTKYCNLTSFPTVLDMGGGHIVQVNFYFSKTKKLARIFLNDELMGEVTWPWDIKGDVVFFIMGGLLQHAQNNDHLFRCYQDPWEPSDVVQKRAHGAYESYAIVLSFSLRGGPNPIVRVEAVEGGEKWKPGAVWTTLRFVSAYGKAIRFPLLFRLEGNGIVMDYATIPLSTTTIEKSVFYYDKETPLIGIYSTGLFRVYNETYTSFNRTLLDWYIEYVARKTGGLQNDSISAKVFLPRGEYRLSILSGPLYKLPIYTTTINLNGGEENIVLYAFDNILSSAAVSFYYSPERKCYSISPLSAPWVLYLSLFDFQEKRLMATPDPLLGRSGFVPHYMFDGKVQVLHEVGALVLFPYEGQEYQIVSVYNDTPKDATPHYDLRYVVMDFYGRRIKDAVLELVLHDTVLATVKTDASGEVFISRDTNWTLAAYRPRPRLVEPNVPFNYTSSWQGAGGTLTFLYTVYAFNPTKIEYNYILNGTTLTIEGTLHETLFNTHVAQAPITVVVYDLQGNAIISRANATTDLKGIFAVQLDLPYGYYLVNITYPGFCGKYSCLLSYSDAFQVMITGSVKPLTPVTVPSPAAVSLLSPFLIFLLLILIVLLSVLAARKAAKETVYGRTVFVKLKRKE